MSVRPERTVERFSRGAELLRRIRAVQAKNYALPLSRDRNGQIERNIREVCEEFDLTPDEWCYWSHQFAAQLTGGL